MKKASQKKQPSKGILIFAHNNTEIDYFRLAVINALMIQKNMGLSKDQITIVTDKHSYKWGQESIKTLMGKAAKYIKVDQDYDFKHKNTRLYKDTTLSPKILPFYNINRCDVYDLSPYDETILIDADYLILSDSLNRCWGHHNELMMNWKYHDVMFDRKFPELDRISPLGITMYWATVVYFKKCAYSENFFNFVKHVRDNRDYYKDLYNFPGGVYRNDYSFSIAAHKISGYKDKGVSQLPIKLYKSFDIDDVHSAPKLNEIMLYLEKPRSPGDFMLTKWAGQNIHIMNKWAINRVTDDLIKHVSSRARKKVA